MVWERVFWGGFCVCFGGWDNRKGLSKIDFGERVGERAREDGERSEGIKILNSK